MCICLTSVNQIDLSCASRFVTLASLSARTNSPQPTFYFVSCVFGLRLPLFCSGCLATDCSFWQRRRLRYYIPAPPTLPSRRQHRWRHNLSAASTARAPELTGNTVYDRTTPLPAHRGPQRPIIRQAATTYLRFCRYRKWHSWKCDRSASSFSESNGNAVGEPSTQSSADRQSFVSLTVGSSAMNKPLLGSYISHMSRGWPAQRS